MAGIGKYTKGKAFKLKSGNSPLFKHMGSPITMNSFGMGQGASPYKQEYSTSDNPNMVENVDESKQSKASDQHKGGGGWKKAAGAALAGLAGGLNSVYGSKIPTGISSDVLKKDDDEVTKKSPGELWLEGQEAGEKLKAKKAAAAEKERLAAEADKTKSE